MTACPNCDKDFNGEAGVNIHQSSTGCGSEGAKTVECDSCDNMFLSVRGMREHHKNKHGSYPQKDTPNGKHGCPSCSDSFRTDQGVKTHHWREHNERLAVETSTCDVCGDGFEYYPSGRCGATCTSDECLSKFYENSWLANNPISGEDHWGFDMEPEENPFYGESHTEEAIEKMSGPRPSVAGQNHPNWKGGTIDNYGSSWTEDLRSAVRNRDGKECQRCGVDSDYCQQSLDVHHITPFRQYGLENHVEANQMDNLVSVCRSCHITVHNTGDLSPEEW